MSQPGKSQEIRHVVLNALLSRDNNRSKFHYDLTFRMWAETWVELCTVFMQSCEEAGLVEEQVQYLIEVVLNRHYSGAEREQKGRLESIANMEFVTDAMGPELGFDT